MPGPENPTIYWDNRMETASLTVTSASSGFGVDSLADADRSSLWRAETIGAQVIQADFPTNSVQEAAALILDNHNLNGLELSLVRASTLDFSDADTVAVFTPNTTAPHVESFSTVTFSSVKLNIPVATTLGQIGELFVGPRFDFERNPVAPFDPDLVRATVLSRESESGRTVNIPRFRKRQVNASFRNVSSAFYVNIKDWWDNRAADGKPFWWSFRPDTEPSKAFFAMKDMDRLDFPLSPFRRDGTLQLIEEI